MSQSSFRGMKHIFGHDSAFNQPLQVIAKAFSDDEGRGESEQIREFTDGYCRWLQESDYKACICFVDITFAPVSAARTTQETKTLIVGSSADQRLEYKRRLDEFLGSPASLAAHPVFMEGLPSFNDGKAAKSPETRIELDDCLRSRKWNISDDRFFLWMDEPKCADPEASVERVYSFSAELTQTFKQSGGNVAKIPERVSDNWTSYVASMVSHKDETCLRSAPPHSDGGNYIHDLCDLGVLVAAPIGIRNPHNKAFTPVADVFFGLSRVAFGDNPTASGKEQTANCERNAIAFLRFLTLHLLKLNVGINQQARTGKWLVGVIGHEVKKVSAALTDRWAPRAEDIFEVGVSTPSGDTTRSTGKLGRLELAPEFSFLATDLGILPFRSQVRAAGKSLQFWSYSDKVLDQPFPDARISPATWGELIDACWESARDQTILYALSNTPANTVRTICDRYQDIQTFKALLSGMSPKTRCNPDDLAMTPLNWFQMNEQDLRPYFALARILIAFFGNCLQHGDLFSPVLVDVYRDVADYDLYHIKLTNTVRPNAREVAVESGIHGGAVVRFIKGLEDARRTSSKIGRLTGSTLEVVKISLDNLISGRVEFSPDEQIAGGNYWVDLSFGWRARP